MRIVRHLAVAIVAALVAAGCGGDETPGVDEARIEVDGSVIVTTPDGVVETLTDDATLSFGDEVAVDTGTAVVRLAGGQEYELRAGPSPSTLEIGAPPTLTAGDVLVRGGFPAQVRHGSSTVSALGATRLSSAVPEVVSYAGDVRIEGAGDLDGLSALHRVVLTSAAVAEPLVFDGADSWDRRYLGEAIAFGERLEAIARGYTADVGRDGVRPASFYEAAIPALADEREFGDDLVEGRAVGEAIVGAAIVVQGRESTFRERWESVFAFRDEGAAWGLVALAQGVSSAPVLDTVELAIAAPPPAPPTTAAPPGPSPTSTTSPSSSTTVPPPGPPSTTVAPPAPDPSPPTTGLLDPVLDPVTTILDELLGSVGL